MYPTKASYTIKRIINESYLRASIVLSYISKIK